MKRLTALIIILALVFVSGCGRKTPPVPPKAVIAKAITDLRSQLDDEAVTLTWTYPRLSVNGARIDTIRTFTVYKAQVPEDDYCSGCPVVYDFEFDIDAKGIEAGNEVRFRDTELQAGYHYIYMVRSNSGWRIMSKDSNRIDFSRSHAMMAPRDIQVDIGDNTLSLSWSPVRHRVDGSQVSGLQYQVYRSLDNKNFKPLGLPVEGLSYIDPSVRNDRTYFYQVRAVLATDGTMTLGRASKTSIGMPVDMTPPTPPSNLLAVVRQDGVQLHWQASTATDVDGYYIYRQSGVGDWKRIARVDAGAITYADNSELAPGAYNYRVTAFDKGARRNESQPSQPVTYTKP